MSCAIMYYLEPTQLIFVHYRLIWSVIIAAIGANMTAGQSGVSYILRILGSFAALFICWLVWYIPDGHVAGVIVFMTLAAFLQNYCLIRWHRYMIGWLVIIVTEVLSIGYELQVKKIGIQAAESTGVLWYHPYTVCAMRVACVLWGTCASIFFTYLPYPITARSSMRKNIATVMRLIGNYHTVVHSTLQARLAGTEGDTTTKGTRGHTLLRTRKTIFNKCTALNASVAHSVYLQKYEPTLGGKFPVEIYTDILNQLSTLLDYVALLSYATQPWSPHAPYFHTSTRTREWIDALSALSRSTDMLEHRITAILYHLASCLATGHPLHQPIERLEPYRLSRRLRELDEGILDVRHAGDLGYSTFAVVEVVGRMVVWRVNLLVERVEGLVGVGVGGFEVRG